MAHGFLFWVSFVGLPTTRELLESWYLDNGETIDFISYSNPSLQWINYARGRHWTQQLVSSIALATRIGRWQDVVRFFIQSLLVVFPSMFSRMSRHFVVLQPQPRKGNALVYSTSLWKWSEDGFGVPTFILKVTSSQFSFHCILCDHILGRQPNYVKLWCKLTTKHKVLKKTKRSIILGRIWKGNTIK